MRKKSQTDRTAREKDPLEKLSSVAEVAVAIRNLGDRINAEPNIYFKAVAVSSGFQGPYSGSRFHALSEIMKAIRALGAAMIAAAYKKQTLPEGMNQLRAFIYQIESLIAQGKLNAKFFDDIR